MLVLNLPNMLTLFRFLLIPVFAVLLIKDLRLHAFITYCVAFATDVLDGYLARKHHQVTQFGRYMDPLADKLLQLTALVILAWKRDLPAFVPIIVVVKEGLMIAGGAVMYRKFKFKLVANWFGKLSTSLFFVAVVLAIFRSPWALWVSITAIGATLYAFLRYLQNFLDLTGKTVR